MSQMNDCEKVVLFLMIEACCFNSITVSSFKFDSFLRVLEMLKKKSVPCENTTFYDSVKKCCMFVIEAYVATRLFFFLCLLYLPISGNGAFVLNFVRLFGAIVQTHVRHLPNAWYL